MMSDAGGSNIYMKDELDVYMQDDELPAGFMDTGGIYMADDLEKSRPPVAIDYQTFNYCWCTLFWCFLHWVLLQQ